MNIRAKLALTLAFAAALAAQALATSSVPGKTPFPKLTAVTALWTSHEGSFEGGFYSTANGAYCSRLFFSNDAGQPISGPGDTETAISVTLNPGETKLRFRAEGWSLWQYYTFSLFFNGATTTPGLSYQYDTLWDTMLGGNPVEALMANDDMFPLVPGTTAKSFVVDGWRITIQNIHVEAGDDQVSNLGRSPNGLFDIVGSITIKVMPANAI